MYQVILLVLNAMQLVPAAMATVKINASIAQTT